MISVLTKKQLAITLSRLATFAEPDMRREQYTTPSEIAADLLWIAKMAGHIESKNILDLGAGTGILGIGAALLDARAVTCIEIDGNALEQLQKNVDALEREGLPVAEKIAIIGGPLGKEDMRAETAIMNPPFGTKTVHADRDFLTYALTHARHTYSIHKTSTIAYLKEHARKLGATLLGEKRFTMDLPRTMTHHRKTHEKIDVTLLVFEAA